MLEQEAVLLTQVLARGARDDPFLVLVTLGRARTGRSSVGADLCQPSGMAQCLGQGGAGLAGSPWAAAGITQDLLLDAAAAANPELWESSHGWRRGQRGVG